MWGCSGDPATEVLRQGPGHRSRSESLNNLYVSEFGSGLEDVVFETLTLVRRSIKITYEFKLLVTNFVSRGLEKRGHRRTFHMDPLERVEG